MKSGSVASVAVLLTLGVLAGVTLVREHGKSVATESEFNPLMQILLAQIREKARQKAARVQAVVDRLGLDDDRDLNTLYDYIYARKWNEKCQSGGESCMMVALSFTTADEKNAASNDPLKYVTSHRAQSFHFDTKDRGKTGMKVAKFKYPRGTPETSFSIQATSKHMSKVRINWLFGRVWDSNKQRDQFKVGVAPNNGGYKCYSDEKGDMIGDQQCWPSWEWYMLNNPKPDAWEAFDNAGIMRFDSNESQM